MKLTRNSILSGKVTTRELPITEEELARWNRGELAQNLWPQLSDGDREFIISGITEDEWEATFGNNYEI